VHAPRFSAFVRDEVVARRQFVTRRNQERLSDIEDAIAALVSMSPKVICTKCCLTTPAVHVSWRLAKRSSTSIRPARPATRGRVETDRAHARRPRHHYHETDFRREGLIGEDCRLARGRAELKESTPDFVTANAVVGKFLTVVKEMRSRCNVIAS